MTESPATRKNPRRIPPSVAGILADGEFLRQRYVNDGLSTSQIAAFLGVSATTVRIWLDTAGIERRKRVGAVRDPAAIDLLADGAWLRRRYIDEGRSIRWISGEFHVHERAVADALRAHGIPIRPNPRTRSGPRRGIAVEAAGDRSRDTA